MSTVAENLWPTDFGEMKERTPVSILREQAIALGQRTANVVVGRVRGAGAEPGHFTHVLSLYSAPLNYEVELLNIRHDINLYPVKIIADGEDAGTTAANPEELRARLKEIFSREKTKKMIASLIAQSQA